MKQHSEQPAFEDDEPSTVPVGTADTWSAPLRKPVVSIDAASAEVHRCRECGTLWRRWQDGSWSLIENKPAGACCDNAVMGEQIEKLWPNLVQEQAQQIATANEKERHTRGVLTSMENDLRARLDALRERVEAAEAREKASETLRIMHAGKQGAADGFQQGWHAVIQRLREGDEIDDISALVPDQGCYIGELRQQLTAAEAQRDDALAQLKRLTNAERPAETL